MKKLSFFLMAMLFSVMSFAAETVAYTLTPAATGSNSSPHNAYASAADWTYQGITWNVTGNSYMVPWRIGGKSITNVDRAVYTKTALAADVTKIEITHGTVSCTINSCTLTVSDAANGAGETFAVTVAQNTTSTITLPEGDYSNKYYKLVYNITVSGSSNKFVQLSEIKFYTEVQTSIEAPTFTPEEGKVAANNTFAEPFALTIASATEGATIKYTLDGTDPALETALTYEAPITISTMVKVRAIAVKGEESSVEATATYIVASTEEKPYTASEAITAQSLGLAASVYVTGTVKSIEEISTQYGNATYNITDGVKELKIYRGKNLENAKFTSEDQLLVGDVVVVKGDLTSYNGAAQLGQNNYLISRIPAVVNYTITVSANPAEAGTVTGAGEYEEGTEATLTATANEGYEFVNWTVAGEEVSTENPYTFTVTADVALVANFKEVEPAATWTVAGAPIFDAHWDPTAEKNDMTLQDNGTYTWEKTEIELAAYTQIEFKVVKDHAWTEAYPASNYKFSVAEDGIYTITITFDPTSTEVAAVATKTGDAEINVEISYVLMGVQGDWTTGIALTQNPENPNEYMLIGQEILAGDAVKVVTLTDGTATAWCGNVEEWTQVGYELDGDGNIVLAPGLYDFYFKVADNVIYIGGEAYPQVVTHTIEGEVIEKIDGRYLTLVAEDETYGDIELNIAGYDGLSESYSISGAIDGVNVEGTCTYTVDEEAGTETLVASVATDDATVKYEITLVYTIPTAQQYLIMMTEGIEAVSEVFEWEDVDEEGNPVTVRIAAYSWHGSNEEWEVYIEAGENIEGAYIYGSATNLTTGQVAELSVVEDSYAIEENYGILSIWGNFTDGLNTYEIYLEGQLPVVEEEGTTKYITAENAEIAPGMDIVTDLEIWAEDEDYNTIMIALTEGTTKMYGDYTADELYISYNRETATLLEETVGTYKLDGEVAVFEATVLCGADTLVLSISGTPWVDPATIVPVETVEMKFYEGTVGYSMGTTNIAGTNAEATLNIGIIGANESNMYDQEWSADDLSWETTLTIADKEVAFIYGTVTIKKDGDDKVVTASLLGDDHVLYVITLTTGKELTTGLENLDTTVAPVKAIVNGQLVIIKNGVQYNATGAVVK